MTRRSWLVRGAIVVAAGLLGALASGTIVAQQVGWTLEYAGAISISLVVSLWFLLFVIDLGFSLLLLACSFAPPPAPRSVRDRAEQLVERVNREIAHVQAFFLWIGVLLPWSPRLWIQVPALLALALLGPAFVDWLTPRLRGARQPLIYLCSIVGLAIILVGSRSQARTLLRPMLALLITTGVRLVCFVRRRRDQPPTSRRGAVLAPGFVVLTVVGLIAGSWWLSAHLDGMASEKLDGPPPDPRQCVVEPGGPVAAQLSMFLIADNQVHELAGDRFPGQTELADLLVPTAVRPVEQDLLGAASVAQLRRAFEAVARDTRGPMGWAHLGDLGDLACTGELTRARDTLSTFAASVPAVKLTGITPGNHDMSFTGNFLWSPYWVAACQSSRADKRASNAVIAALLDPARGGVDAGARTSVPAPSWWSWLTGTGGLVTVTPLGAVVDHARPRTVVAIFLDTSDDATFDWGLAGVFGSYSAAQDARMRAMIEGLKVDDPLWVVFVHHPLGELTTTSRRRVEASLAWLDHGAGGARRLLAVVAAHTHHAETHRVCVGDRVVREIVVGSTIDAPQQAAVLAIGSDASGAASLRLATVPTVARPGLTCAAASAPAPMIDASTCRGILASLQSDPACAPMFAEDPALAARSCSDLEADPSFTDELHAMMSSANPIDPTAIKQAQAERARRVLTCVCRGGGCTAPGPTSDPFDPTAIPARLATGGPAALDELACLAWASSAQQKHKVLGMTFASALRCAFDDRFPDAAIPAAQSSVATMAVEACSE